MKAERIKRPSEGENLTDAKLTQLLGALLQGDMGGSPGWADAIWPVEKAFIEAHENIVRSQETEQ